MRWVSRGNSTRISETLRSSIFLPIPKIDLFYEEKCQANPHEEIF
jgi:hypothetical protein